MAGASAAVGNDGGSTFHHRLPIRVGHIGYKHIAGFDGIHLRCIFYQTYSALPHPLADGAPLAQHVFLTVDGVAAQTAAAVFLRFHGFGTGLQDIEFAVDAVATPFDVHRAAVVFFNRQRVLCQLGNFFVGNGEAVAVFFGHIDVHHGFTGFGFVGENHFDLFRTHSFAQNRGFTRFQRGFEHIEFVGVNRALNDVFAQAVGRSNENDLVVTGFGVESEHHAGCAAVGTDHTLHTCRQRHHVVRKAFMNAVRNGAVVVQGGKHMVHGFFYIIQAVDIQESFLLACKRCVGQVFCGGRRTHRYGNVRTTRIGHHFIPRLFDFGVQLFRKRRVQNPLADFLAHTRQLGNIFNVQLGQRGRNAFAQAFVRQKSAVGFGCGRKTAGNAHALFSQLTDHLAQRGVFTAHTLHIGHAQVFKPNNVVVSHLLCPIQNVKKEMSPLGYFKAFNPPLSCTLSLDKHCRCLKNCRFRPCSRMKSD